MADCCSTKDKDINSQEISQTLSCPNCLEKGRPVNIMTLKSLLIPDAMKRINSHQIYQFCRLANCPIVYFNESGSFSKTDLNVKVFQKENEDTTPVCYCFGYNKKQLREDVIKNGKSIIQEEIKNYTKDNKCACEIRNPQGSCCLGNVSLTLK